MNKLIVLSIDGLNQFYMDESAISMPVLRAVSRSGGRVSELKTCYPSVTWAAHSCVLTGCTPQQTGVYGNTVYDRSRKCSYSYFDPTLSGGDKLIRRETIFDALNRAGCTVASVCWPMTHGFSSVKYNIPEFYQNSYFEAYATKELWQSLSRKGIPVEEYAKWSSNHALGHLQDELTTQIACHIIQNTETDVLFFHYLLTDSYLHDFGAHSPEVRWACEYVDTLLGKLLKQADASWRDYDLMVFTDHGQTDIRKYFHANAALARIGLYDPEHPENSQVLSVSNGGSSFLYTCDGSEALHQALREFSRYDVVEEIWDREELARRGYISYGDKFDFLPDAIISYQDGVCCSNTVPEEGIYSPPTRYKSTHGFSPSHPNMNGFLVAAGSHFQKGAYLPQGALQDIAPTIAEIFHLDFSAQGRPLHGLLKTESK